MVSWHSNFDNKIKFSFYVYDVNGKKNFQGLPKRWNCLEEDRIRLDAEDTHVAIRTGEVNDITVLDIDDMTFFESNFDLLNNSTYTDQSYSGKRHLYYRYNKNLKSICFGKFDILSDDKQAMLGKPLNDLPILEMPKEVEKLLIEELSVDKTDLSELVTLMDESYVLRSLDWRAIGQDFKYMGASLYDWIDLSKKDESGFKKNFDTNRINSQVGIWNSEFMSCKEFDSLLRTKASEIKKLLKSSAESDNEVRAIEEDCYKFAPGMVLFKNGRRIFRDIFDNSVSTRAFKCRNIVRLAKKFDDHKVLDWLIENGWINLTPSYGCVVKNRFDLNDPFYWNDFVKLLTLRDKIYFPSEVVAIICNNLHRVLAYVDNDFIIKKSNEYPFEIYNERNFPDFSMSVRSEFGNITSFRSQLKANPWILPSINFKKCMYGFDFRYSDQNAFYCTKPFLAKSINYPDRINELLSFIYEIICNGNLEVYDYFMKWLAFCWKFPFLKSGKAVLMFSKEGCGKGSLVEFLTKYLFGIENCIPNIDYSDLMSNKTDILSNKKLVCVNELESTRGQKLANQQRLKSYITEDKISINRLYCNLKTQENRMEFVFMTNNELSLRIDNNDRRYLMLSLSDSHVNDIDYFTNLRNDIMNQECADAFAFHLDSLLETPNDFMKLKLPITEYKKEVIRNSNFDSDFYKDFIESIKEGSPLCEPMTIKYKTKDCLAWHRLELFQCYVEWVKSYFPGTKAHTYPKFKKLAFESNFLEEIQKKDVGRVFILVADIN